MIVKALFFRFLKRRPLRYIVTVVGVAVGIASIISTVLASNAAIASLREGVEEIAGRAKLELTRPGGIDQDLLGDLRPVARDAVIAPVIEEIALLPKIKDSVRILGVDPMVDRIVRDLDLTPQQKESAFEVFSKLLTGQGALVPQPLAQRLDVDVGDTIKVSVRTRLELLEVVGILEPRRLSSAWDRILIVDIALAQKLFGAASRIDRIELMPRRGVSVDELKSQVRATVPTFIEIQTPNERAEQTGKMVRALEFNLTALSGMSLLVGAVLVATTLATSVVQRREVIALLRSLGASRVQIVSALLVEAALIGLFGGILGIIGGYLGAQLALASVRATMAVVIQGAPKSDIIFSPIVAAVAIAIGIVVSLIASVLPLIEAYHTPPLQNLRAERPEFMRPVARRYALLLTLALLVIAGILAQLPPIAELPIAALLGALCLLAALLVVASPFIDWLSHFGQSTSAGSGGRMLRISVAIMAAGRRRISWAAGAIGVTVALAIGIATMVASFRVTVEDWSRQSLRSDIVIRPIGGETGVMVGRLDPQLVDIARDLFGDKVVDPFYTTRVSIDDNPVTLGAGALEVVRHHGGVPFMDSSDSKKVFTETLRKHGAIVNEPFANRYDVEKGDTIELSVRGGKLEREVTGVFYDYSRSEGMVIIDIEDYLQIYPADGPQTIALFFPEGADLDAARDRLVAALDGRWLVDVLFNRELRLEVLKVFDRTFAITRALQVVSSLVAVIAVLTVLFALAGERRQDMALLRALGGSRRQIVALVTGEAGLLGLIGAAGGLVAGLSIGWLLVKVVNVQSFGWTLRFLPPWSTLWAMFVWVVVACLVAGLAPAVYSAWHTPWEVLREDE